MSKITAKNKKTTKKQDNRQSQIFQISNWKAFQAKIPSRSGVCVQRKRKKYTLPYPLLSKDKGLRDIGYCMSIGNIFSGANSVTVSYLLHYDSLLQNATDKITKCDSHFIAKCDRSL